MSAEGKYDHDKTSSFDRIMKSVSDKVDEWIPEDEYDTKSLEFSEGDYWVYVDLTVKSFREYKEHPEGIEMKYIDFDIDIESVSISYLDREDDDMTEMVYNALIKKYK